MDVYKGRERGQAHVDACGQEEMGGQKLDFRVDVINGWPLMYLYITLSFTPFTVIIIYILV